MEINETTIDELLQSLRGIREELERVVEKFDEDKKTVLVSCNEAARLLGVTPTTVSQMLKRHKLTKRTIGRSTGIPLSDIIQIKNT